MSSRSGAPGATKAVILARGLGTRMRADNPDARLDARQRSIADTGVKAMIPVGRPFLDYVLSELADAGFSDVCLVIGPEHVKVRDYYQREAPPKRVRIAFAEQAKPLGTADAVAAAEEFAGSDLFAVLNSDNYYPETALAALRACNAPAVVGFDRDALIELGNTPAESTARFGALDIDDAGFLRRIMATPDAAMLRRGQGVYASMNCWLFDSAIFSACREVGPSRRGELELPQAVQLAIDRHGMKLKVIMMRAGVLDLSSRGDIAVVAERLRDVKVSL